MLPSRGYSSMAGGSHCKSSPENWQWQGVKDYISHDATAACEELIVFLVKYFFTWAEKDLQFDLCNGENIYTRSRFLAPLP